MKNLSILGLALLLLMVPVLVTAAAPGQEVRQSIDKIIAILNDPQLQGKAKEAMRRQKLKQAINERFDFTEMAKRSLGAEWRRLTPEQQNEFVRLFTGLLEDAYLERIDSYNDEKVQYLKERQDGDYAEVDTKIIDNKGREFALNYKLYNVNGDWKIYDVVIEDISLVNNYRAQFNRVLAKSSVEDLLKRMREKQFSAPVAKS